MLPSSKEKIKCFKCNKKLTALSYFDCKCGKNFCSEHRLYVNHECAYNHRDQKKDELKKILVEVKPEKLKDRA